MNDIELLRDADERAARYLSGIDERRVFPDGSALARLADLDESLPVAGLDPQQTLALLDDIGSPATVASNGPRYFGFVIGASWPPAMAAERLALAWDQCASSSVNSPVGAFLERVAGRWLLEILDLPRDSAVGFGTSATACGIACLATARRALLARHGWDVDRRGLAGAPEIRVVVSETVHVTVIKALRLLGFGTDHLMRAPVDAHGRIDPDRLPALDDRTILCLQAGEVNTGEFDPFPPLMAAAKQARAWVHVDGAFGLWARASRAHRVLTEGVDGADSWTTDGHKWLNTPYDCAVSICRQPELLAATMNADASYSSAEPDAQKNLTLEFSRRARGIAIWAALRTLGRDGVAEMVERHCRLAGRLAQALRDHGIEVLNRVVLNQVLGRCGDDDTTRAFVRRAQASGEAWFGESIWQGRPAFRMSVSSWKTTDDHIDRVIEQIPTWLD